LLIVAFNSAFGRPGEFSRDEPHNAAGLAQLFLVLQLLAGRPHEASRLISSHYFAKGLDKKYEDIYKDTTEVSAWLSLFVTRCMNVMIKRYLNTIKPEQIETLSIEAEPSISNYTLSFFSSLPLPRSQKQNPADPVSVTTVT
jgi:hypothetical protein